MVDIMKRKKRKNDEKEGSYLHKAGIVLISVLMMFSVLVVGFGVTETVEGDEQLQSTGISDWYDLDDIRNDMEGDYHLENDLDEDTAGYEDVHHDEYGFQPIGANENGSEEEERFDGSFDGQGHTIDGLWMDVYSRASLFASLEDSVGFIGNFELTNFELKSEGNVGAIIRLSRGNYVQDVSINNGEIASTFENDDNVGGIVSLISLDESDDFIWLKNSYVENVDFVVNEADVEDRRVGSLIGLARGIAENSYAIDNTLTTNDLEVSKSPLVGTEGTDFGSLDNCFYHEDMEEEFGDSESAVDLTDSEFTSYSTFDDAGWDITTVESGETDDSYTWNIVDGHTEPFLSFEENPLEDYAEVDTVGSSDIGVDYATLEGELTELEEYDDVETFFEYRNESTFDEQYVEIEQESGWGYRDRPVSKYVENDEGEELLLVSFINHDGEQTVKSINMDTGEEKESIVEETIGDLHNVPPIMVDSDGYVWVFPYPDDSFGAEGLYWRVSEEPYDVSDFGELNMEQNEDMGRSQSVGYYEGTIYVQNIAKPDDPGYREHLWISDDYGESWEIEWLWDFNENEEKESDRSYTTMYLDEEHGNIHFTMTELDHGERDYPDSPSHGSVYYIRYDIEEDEFYHADGSYAFDWGDTPITENDKEKIDVIWDFDDNNDIIAQHWGDIKTDDEGNPYLTWARQKEGYDAFDLFGYWARFDDNSGEWESYEVGKITHHDESVSEGEHMHHAMSGNVMLNPNDLNQVYASLVTDSDEDMRQLKLMEFDENDEEIVEVRDISEEKSGIYLPKIPRNPDGDIEVLWMVADGLDGWSNTEHLDYIEGYNQNYDDWQTTDPETMTTTGTSSHEVDGLDPDTTYEFRAVVQTPDGNELYTGDTMTFTTSTGDDDDGPLITDPEDYDGWTEWLMDNPLLVVLAVVFVILISKMASDED